MKIQKSEAEYNMKSVRFLLLTITTMFIFLGLLMIVIGISVYSRYHDFSFIYESAKDGRLFTPSIMVIIVGMVLLVVTSFGFFGSLKESTCMVNMYALCLVLILIVELALVIVAFTVDPEDIFDYINIPVENYAVDSEIAAELDLMQTSLNCCGQFSKWDYAGQEFTPSHSTVKVVFDFETLTIPKSCCADVASEYCSRVKSNNCTTAIVNMIMQNTSVLGVLATSVLIIQVLGITFALLLARGIRKFKSETTFRKWNDRERMIIARDAHKTDQTTGLHNGVHWLSKSGSTDA